MKLFVVIRNDLAPGLQAAQAVHAKELFSHEHPEVNSEWYEKSNNIVLLQVPNKESLVELAYRMMQEKIALSLFREPDLQDEPTALALSPQAARHLSSLPLALRKPRQSVSDHPRRTDQCAVAESA